MKLSLISVGRIRPPLADAVAEYERRVGRYFRFDSVEVRESAGRAGDEERVRSDEGERLLARVPIGSHLVVLDRVGESWSSPELAAQLDGWALRAMPAVAFVIGGANGVSPALLAAAHTRFSLGRITLPHEMARLVLAEQLYRAGTILRGEPYHKQRTP